MFDVLIIGGGVSGMSCALVLGSAKNKPFALDKKIGIIAHQKASSLRDAIFYNAYGVVPGKLGADILQESISHLKEAYPHVEQFFEEKVLKIEGESSNFSVITNKNSYHAKVVIVAIGAGNPFTIDGLEEFVMPHKKANPVKNRIQLQNQDHLVKDGLYVSGTLAGHRSQFSIAAGSGAAVATDILTLWNENQQTHVHDSLLKK
ncbi:MAG: FAD-dependent oxidoreductase [Flavobacteriaceae bacterium]|jgi:thioredoxin reductase|nr:FAD-dependent oxidoreductase [Flavobacteriaceae bacterium]